MDKTGKKLKSAWSGPVAGLRCAAIYSGGKDGHLALLRAMGAGAAVSCLVTIDGGPRHASFFHDLRKVPLLRAHARLMGLPLAVCPPAGFAPKEAGLAGALRLLARAAGRRGFDLLVSGASDLDDAGGAADFRSVGAGLGLRVETPAAALDVPDAVVECARLGVKAVIVGTERAVDPRWLGREFGLEFCEYILRLRARGVKVDGNDFQTLVTDSPAFSAPVELLSTRALRLRDRSLLKVLSFRAGRAVVTNAV